ncbi:MAG: TonB C-terminal domain-containing protein [candidate division Zixibacteria bacterium]|nr:TonB C-terminal domain-containing protein [candidate division Zixibacteria bacterium]NIR63403.1 TonB C-terminal domain-containing protein [candidate division Zixibacteria bacterium]NIS17549.1 TonB C-terminal domain-containing protein [candidate division Zixibacteria bacterium]NIS45511.1 TonB C-terminal domain-containing protein [candidate division Zixibacteria bacterium]NIT53852.1 TonB C-terminal domain-containing protein [candidate division Zixibacteria bacterium]
MKKTDYLISFMIHITVLALIIILSAGGGRASIPELGPVTTVSMTNEIPKGFSQPEMPSLQAPAAAADNAPIESEPVKLKSQTEKVEVKKPEPEPQQKEPEEIEEPPEQPDEQLADAGNSEQGTAEAAPSGESMDISAAGSPDGSGIPSGPLGEYYLAYDFNIVRWRIKQNWQNPIKSNTPISCKIYFQITKDGSIKGVTVRESSGNELFDRYAKLAVQSTGRLPSLPQSFPDNEVLGVNLTFTQRP